MAPRTWKHFKKDEEREYYAIKLKHGMEIRVARTNFGHWFGRLLVASKFKEPARPEGPTLRGWGTVAETRSDDDLERVKRTSLLLAQRTLRESLGFLEEGEDLLPPKECTHAKGKSICTACLYKAIQALG